MIFKNLFKNKELEKEVRKLKNKIDDISNAIGIQGEEGKRYNPFGLLGMGYNEYINCELKDKINTLYKHFKLQYINKECKTNIVRKINKSKK